MAIPKFSDFFNVFIEFDIGVTTQKVYKLKRIDNDFFSEE